MIVYDITKEMFSADAYPGDPIPRVRPLKTSPAGDGYHLSRISIGSHISTHIDAPMHFIEGGRDCASIDISRCMGPCVVVTAHGEITAGTMQKILTEQQRPSRILFRGHVLLTEAAARALTVYDVKLVGFDSLHIAAPEVETLVHVELLQRDVVILEDVNLDQIKDGRYFLVALPLKMEGLDGSPTRAVLMLED